MKHTVVRAQPVEPPVEKIILEVTREELAQLFVVVAKTGREEMEHKISRMSFYRLQAPVAADLFPLFQDVKDAAVEAGVAVKVF